MHECMKDAEREAEQAGQSGIGRYAYSILYNSTNSQVGSTSGMLL